VCQLKADRPDNPKSQELPKAPKEPATAGGEEGEGESKPAKKRPRRRRGAKKTAGGDFEGQATTTSNSTAQPGTDGPAPAKKRKERVKKEKPVREKVLSDTTLFVANLPFNFTDDDLKGVFDGPGFVSARVVRTRNLRSRGYGFVEFENSECQQQAMNAKQGFQVGEGEAARTLSISVSSSPAPEVKEEGGNPQ